ncbi:MAG: ankyrin repeat domain-containing protein [Acidiferrobacterales bacterium]|nr:ankyrin repeat domain-containing protein [Acidiferrobacterales bacterium]
MSERGLFAVLGFDNESHAQEFRKILNSLGDLEQENNKRSLKLKSIDHFIDSLEYIDQFDMVVMAEWNGGRSLDSRSIKANLKAFLPKYLSIEEWEDDSRSRTSGFTNGKSVPYAKVMNSLKKSSLEVAYMLALRSEQSKKIVDCLEAGVDPHASHLGENVLVHQHYDGSTKVIIALIKAGANPNAQDIKVSYGETPLHLALECEKLDIVEALIAAGADVNRMPLDPYDPAPPFHSAIGPSAKHRKMAKLLLDAGADIDAVNGRGFTALLGLMWDYSDRSPLAELKFLAEEGADINYYHEEWGNPMWSAIENEFSSCIKYFKSRGLEPRAPIERRATPRTMPSEYLAKIKFLEDHEKSTGDFAKQVSVGQSYWPQNDKEWTKERQEVWKFYEKSIRGWFMGNVKSQEIKELKNYFINGEELTSNIGSYTPFFVIWLHPSRNEDVLRSLIDWKTHKYNVGYYYFFAGIPSSQIGGREGPRNKYIANLMYEYCFETDGDNIENAARFINLYIRSIPSFLKTFNPYDKVEYLLPNFIKCLNLVTPTNLELIKDEEIGLHSDRNRYYRTSAINHMFESIENFTIDKLPEYRV